MYYLVYETTNLINNKRYIGIHQTEDIDDGYMGSGKALKAALKKYGQENFVWNILKYCKDSDEMLAEEARIVNEDWVKRDDNYNLTLGGKGSWEHMKNTVVVKDENGETLSVSTDDSRYLNGELVGVMKGYKHSDETNEKNRLSHTGITRSPEACKNISESKKGSKNPAYGKPAYNRGKTMPYKGVPHEKIECPHCSKIGGKSAMKRYHFDNCRNKTLF